MTQKSTAIRSVIVRSGQDLLLLPGSLVAEVVSYMAPAAPPVNAPPWLVGVVVWREQQVPLISMEAFFSKQAVQREVGNDRIAVLKVLSESSPLLYYGIVTQHIPRLATVRRDALTAAAEGINRTGVAMQVALDGEPMIIPDVDALEAELFRVWQAA